MYSQRFIRNVMKAGRIGVYALLLCLALIAGCGGTSGTKPAATDGSTAVADRDVPERARTLYEQAVAVMASGDYLEAQLRFQEFLLQ